MKRISPRIHLLGALAFVLSCATTPITHRKQLLLVPESQVDAMGAQAYAEVLQNEKRSTNRELTAVVERVGRRIAAASGKKYDWEFNLIESDEVNAFCLPGGKVAFYTGIMPIAQNEAAVAAIMGHEVAHAVLKHGNERISQGLIAQTGLSVAAATLGNNQYHDLLVGMLGLGTQVGVLLPFSRKHESEADVVGLRYMAMAGYDPQEAVKLWERMAAAGGKMPEFLSTHPDPAKRARKLEGMMADVMPLYAQSEKQPTRPLPLTASAAASAH